MSRSSSRVPKRGRSWSSLLSGDEDGDCGGGVTALPGATRVPKYLPRYLGRYLSRYARYPSS